MRFHYERFMINLDNDTSNWVASWYAAPSRMLSAALSGRTLRQIVHLHAGGEKLRIRLSNRYGDRAVSLASISVGHVIQDPLLSPQTPVNFGGHTSVTLEPRQDVVSDPIAFSVKAFSDLAITFFLVQGESLTGHIFAGQTSFVSGPGDVSATPSETAFLVYPLHTISWWLITGCDVLPSTPVNAVVAFGSSTTDGAGSTLNANKRWPDYLANRLRDAGRLMSVVNAGLAGNQLTMSELPLGMPLPPFLFGEAGQKRLVWDVLGQSGATDLIIHIGSNDLRGGVSASTLIEAFRAVTTEARKKYRHVFGTTILPGGKTIAQAEQCRIVNVWMRDQGRECFDAVFDFATPLKSPNDETKLNPAYDSGDGIHPNDEGYRLMAEAVDIDML
jgi:lysophospholipase L1-like esterase